jgi:hypothetical protein
MTAAGNRSGRQAVRISTINDVAGAGLESLVVEPTA